MSDGPIAAFRDSPRWLKVVVIVLAMGAIPSSIVLCMGGMMMIIMLPEHPFFDSRSVIGKPLEEVAEQFGRASSAPNYGPYTGWDYTIYIGHGGGINVSSRELLVKVDAQDRITKAEFYTYD